MPRHRGRVTCALITAMAVRSMQSTLHMPSRGYGPTLNAHTVPTVHANASPWEAGSSLFRASSLSDWLRPEAAAFPGLHLPRRPSWPNYQVEIDQVQGDFRAEGDFGALETTVSKVEGGSGWDFELLGFAGGRQGGSRWHGACVGPCGSQRTRWLILGRGKADKGEDTLICEVLTVVDMC